jgi:predicted PurR-regulated permease PerM
MIPFVGYVVIAGVALALLAQGAAWTALAVAVWGSLVVFVGDKVVRPLAVGRAVKLNLFWVLVGSLGGFEVLGLIGLFVGPVVLALCAELWREWVPQEQRLPHAPTEHGRFPDDPGRRGRYAESVSSSPRKRP